MKKIMILAGASLIALSSAVSAATFSYSGGVNGMIPGAGAKNDVLDAWGYPGGVMGIFGTQVFLEGGPATVKVSYMGFEAGFRNRFEFGGIERFSTEVGDTGNDNIEIAPDPFTPLASIDVAGVATGLLDFEFIVNEGAASVKNGSNTVNGPGTPVNFFVSGNSTVAYLFFDDNGAGNDDNHDDMVIRLSLDDTPGGPIPTPLPAAGFLLVGALGGLGLVKRRNKKA